ncbi:ATP-binding protein [Streptomyces sp. NPDC058417]
MTLCAFGQAAGLRTALDVSIERQPDPGIDGLSPQDAAWPKRLRCIVRASLTYWGQADLIESAELLLTELATNALRHGTGKEIGVRLFVRDGRCVIQVSDGSTSRPELRHAGVDEEGGRGLILVDSLSESWGVSPDGTTVWCILQRTEGSQEMPPAAVIDRSRSRSRCASPETQARCAWPASKR